jgi:hypothetical protein
MIQHRLVAGVSDARRLWGRDASLPFTWNAIRALQASSSAGFQQETAFHLKCHRSIYSYHPSPEKTGVRPFIY